MKSPSPIIKSQHFQNKIIKLQQQFLKACLSYQAHPNYCYLYIQSFDKIQYSSKQEQYKKKTYLFADEINQLKKGESFHQRMSTVLSQRQQILRSLRQEFITNRNQKPLNITQCCQKLSHIRMYNLTIVQQLQALKLKLKINEAKYITQICNKLIRDLDFLRLSPLRKHIEFSSLDDPFFLIPLKKIWDLQLASNYHHKSVVQLFTVENNYKKRLQTADKLIKNIVSSQNRSIRKELKKEQDHQIEKKGKNRDNNYDENQTTSKFFLPSTHKDKQNIGEKSRKSENSVQNIIKNYQNRQKIRKEYSRYMQNANKKRAATQASRYQSQRNYSSLQNPTKSSKKKLYSIDDDYNDQPESTYFKYFPTKDHIANQQTKEQPTALPQRQTKNPFDSIQVRPFNLSKEKQKQSNKQFKNQKDSDQNSIKIGRRNKKNTNRNRQYKLKQTVYNNFPLKNNDEEAKQTKHKLNSNTSFRKQQKNPQKQLILSNIGSKLPSINEVDQQKADKKYKNPLDILKQVRYRKKQLQGNIMHYDQKDQLANERDNSIKKSSINQFEQYEEKQDKLQQKLINQGLLIQKLIQSMKKAPPKLQIQPLNLNQKFQIALPKNQTENNNLSYSFVSKNNINHQKDPSPQKQKQIQSKSLKHSQVVYNKKEINKQLHKDKKRKRIKPLSMHKQFSIQSNNSDKQFYAFQTQVTISKSQNNQYEQEQKADKRLTLQKQYQIHTFLEQKNQINTQEKARRFQNQRKLGQIDNNKHMRLQKQYSFNKNQEQAQKKININNNPSYKFPLQYNSNPKIVQKTILEPPQTVQNIFYPKSYQKTYLQTYKGKQYNQMLSLINQQPSNTVYSPKHQFQNIRNNINSQNMQYQSKNSSKNKYQSQFITPKSQERSIRRNQNIFDPNPHIKPRYLAYPNSTHEQPEKSYYSNAQSIQKRQPQQIHFQIKPSYKEYKNKQQISPSKNRINQYKKQQLPQSKVNISFDQQSRYQPSVKESSKPSFSKQQTKILKQCVFQSKSIEQSQLISILSSYKSKKSSILLDFTRKGSYFMNRHIIFSTCTFNNETVCYCITSPYLTLQSRYLFILHLEILQQAFQKIATQLFSTFIKYIFFNDPTNNLLYLRLKNIFDEQYVQCFQMVKNYSGQMKTPIKSQNFDDKSYLFVRKDIKCRATEDYTSIFNTIALFLTNKNEDQQLEQIKNKTLYFSSSYLKRIQASLKLKQVKKFQDNTKLQKYLEQYRLPKFKQSNQTKNLILYEMILEDCLTNVRYYAISKYFYFTIQPPYTYFFSSQNIYYLFISTTFKNKYYVIADKIYQESQNVDIYKDFKKNVRNKKINDFGMNQSIKGKIVSCPQFKKTVQANFTQNTSVIINFELNWKDYIKGARYIRQQQIYIQLIGPLLCSLVEIGQDKVINHIYSTIIQASNIGK